MSKRLWENEAELLQEYYDNLPDDLRKKTPKPPGYRKPKEKPKPKFRGKRKRSYK